MTENKTLQEIKSLINLWEEKKQERKSLNDFFKLENKIDFIDKLNNKILNQFLKAKDKSGFIMIYDKDIFKLYLKKYYEKNNVFFIMKNDKLFLMYDKVEDILSCADFKSYAFKVLEENKERERQKKEKLKNKKTGLKLETLNKETLQAVILQARLLLNKKEVKQ